LALEVTLEKDGTGRISGIWDYRDDPEGIHFAECPDEERARRVEVEWLRREPNRRAALGYMVQPVGSLP
jgi:hypothetical protein